MLYKKLNTLLSRATGIVLMSALVATAVPSMTGGARANDPRPIRLAVGVDAAFTPVFLAKHEKLFEAAGLDVQLQQFANSNEGLDAINAGLADLAGAAEPGTLARIARGDIRPLAIFGQSGSYIKLAVKSGIGELSQIKKIGVVRGSVSEYATGLLLTKFDIDAKGVQLIPAGPPELPALLLGGSIDAYFVWEPWPTVGVKQGAKVLLTSGDVGYVYTMWLSANGTWLDKNADQAKKVLATLAEACAIVRAEEAKGNVARLAEANKALAKLPQEQTEIFLSNITCVVRDFSPADVDSFDRIAAFLADQKITPSKVDFRKALQFGFFKD